MAKTVIVFDPINPRLPSIRIRLADAAADALVATGAAVFPVIDTSLSTGIVVPPPAPTVTLSLSVSQAEGNSGPKLFTFTVTASQAAPAGGLVVPVAFSTGSTNAADYTGGTLPSLTSVTIAAGQTSADIVISVNGDTDVESDESFGLTISAPAGYTLLNASATGTIVNDDVSSVATPQQPEESIISPANVSLRSTYVFTKQGAIVGMNPAMAARGATGLGPYWPKIVYAPSAAYPDRHIVFYTTDHDLYDSSKPGSGTGGVYLMTCVADPGVAANWKTYADAVAAGWWNDVPSRPAAEPIYIGPYAANTPVQAETIWVNWVPEANLWVGTYQVTAARATRLDGTTYGNQATIMATSPDLLNWTGNNIAVTLPPADKQLGDGHTGYFNWGPNPFPGLINPATSAPWKYVGYCSMGGQGASPETQWGSDNPGAAPALGGSSPWTFLSTISPWGGRAAPNYPNSDTNDSRLVTRWLELSSFRATRQGYAGLMTGGPATAGQGSANRSVYEVLMDATGREMLGRPIQVVTKSSVTGGDDGTSAHAASIVNFGDRRVVAYEGQGSGTNKLLIATSPKRNPANTWFDPLNPVIPAGYAEIARNVRGASAVPAGFTAVTGGAPAAPTFDANGMTIALNNGQEYYLFEDAGFMPNQTPYVDLFLEGWRSLAASAERYPYIGFAHEKAIRSGLLNALFVSNGEGTGTDARLSGIVGGAAPVVGGAWAYYEGIGYGSSTAATQGKDIGIRWFPQAGRLLGLGLGRTEVRMDNAGLAGLDLTQRFYAFVGFKGVGSAAQERIQRIVVRTKDESNVLVALTPSTDFIQGVAVSGTLTGAKAGSTITSNIPGITVDSPNRTYSGTPTGSGTIANAFVETLAGYGGSPYPTPVTVEAATTAFLYDKFSAADGTDVTYDGPDADTDADYSPIIGGKWSKHNGSTSTPSIKSGRFSCASAGSSPRIINATVPPKADYKVEADFTFVGGTPSTSYAGIMLRLSSTALQGYGVYWNGANSQWRLMRWTGTGANINTLAATPAGGQTYHLEVRAVGTTISAYVDGTLIGTASDTNYQAAGGVGIHYPNNATDAAGIQIDNLKATAL
ncbi:hypothetical protein [Sphingomonas profundi]|uniref:hypothetical protein n=1 Tax=Alterirhizorhabdus profundi TaxID=2681549 RepID=UPI0012E79D86|nr:hypothetical protein [Sphingomonas profundi]